MSQLPLPDWLDDIAPEKRARERKRFLLRAAALYATPDGGLRALSKVLGLSHNTLHTTITRNSPLSVDLTKAVETLVGRDKLPRELLNPEVYQIGE